MAQNIIHCRARIWTQTTVMWSVITNHNQQWNSVKQTKYVKSTAAHVPNVLLKNAHYYSEGSRVKNCMESKGRTWNLHITSKQHRTQNINCKLVCFIQLKLHSRIPPIQAQHSFSHKPQHTWTKLSSSFHVALLGRRGRQSMLEGLQKVWPNAISHF